ncbi:MerR family transcriptional regulator [Mucilaginibacter paludis]|uniref:Regulatory protein MerR n=1 Tax=Mucilaginibacter paludis DSM 18603 TaxID=714943 RepID=H1YAE3_9SPHI|nr:MerR family transcriptional regulator [Mucilaginibacter paludis]EHQ26986.1 regulatory protein MerR [Mucilaginibacter paludis DSM 18603]
MEQQIQFVGFSMQEAERFLKNIVSTCIDEHHALQKHAEAELPLTPSQASKALKVSLPTLRRYVQLGLIRRHDLGPRRKVFYLSELEEDVKKVEASVFTHR